MPLLASLALLGVLYAWLVACFPLLARRRRIVVAALLALWAAHLVSYWLFRREIVSTLPRAIVELALLPLLMAALPITGVRVVSWAIGRAASARRRRDHASAAPATDAVSGDEAEAHGHTPGADGLSRRQVVEASAGLAILGGTGSMLGWGMFRGRHAFELCEVPVRIDGLPRALDGYVIVQVSDIHAGFYVGEREFEEGFALIRRARPDRVVVTGDLVDFDSSFAGGVARKLVDLGARDGVTAVLGNHDYYADRDEVAEALEAAGVELLVDAGRVVRPRDGGGFALLGVDDRWSTRYGRMGPRLDVALAAVPADRPRVLLSHQPVTVDRWPGRVALQLSGHTHGGQINPGFRPADLFLKYVAGAYRVGGTFLYVNRGFGTVGTPSRVGAPPEVTRVVLVAA
jgi:hypothetical protein